MIKKKKKELSTLLLELKSTLKKSHSFIVTVQ